MPVKGIEVQRLTVGVLYLIRHGITHDTEVILQRRLEVTQLLPGEDMLCKHHGIHPKFITETETRIKFCLRTNIA
jgi:hypothetical protein